MNELEQEGFAPRAQAWQPTQPVALPPGHLWVPILHPAGDHLSPALLVHLSPCHIPLQDQAVPLPHTHVDRVERSIVFGTFYQFKKLSVIVLSVAWVMERVVP